MQNTLDFISTPQGQLLLTTVSTFVAIIAGLISSLKMSRIKKPIWYFTSTSLLDLEAFKWDDINVTYKGESVKNLIVVNLFFWNAGKEALKKEDIVEELLISTSDNYKILETKLITQSRNSNDFTTTISKDGKSFSFSFNYLNYKQGGLIQFLSNCVELKNICFEGVIIGCNHISNGYRYYSSSIFRQKKILKIEQIIVALFIIYLIMSMTKAAFSKYLSTVQVISRFYMWIYFFVEIFLAGCEVVMIIHSIIVHTFVYTKRMPHELKKYINLSDD